RYTIVKNVQLIVGCYTSDLFLYNTEKDKPRPCVSRAQAYHTRIFEMIKEPFICHGNTGLIYETGSLFKDACSQIRTDCDRKENP
ncbi:MAG: hypothetical protein U0L06_05970, partial [Agathobacter sp.]|nr:hypothetical protein [Agathobacter sp.]